MVGGSKLLINVVRYGIHRVYSVQTGAALKAASRSFVHLPEHQYFLGQIFYTLLDMSKTVYRFTGDMGLGGE